MPLTINTNVPSLIAQRNLNNATTALNTSIERMSTGYKINHAKDNAAGHSIANLWVTQLGSLDVASDNASMGSDLLTTAEDTYELLTSHLQRVRDLTEQAANGTYGDKSKEAIQSEILARLNEVDRIAANAEYNGIHLMDASITADIKLQVGLYADPNSQIVLSKDLFAKADTQTLLGKAAAAAAKTCSGLDTAATAESMLATLDTAISKISSRVTDIGAVQNRVESAITALDVQSQNLTSSLSTLRDTDVADESSNYIKAQILQQASATLLSTANQLPSIALNLI